VAVKGDGVDVDIATSLKGVEVRDHLYDDVYIILYRLNSVNRKYNIILILIAQPAICRKVIVCIETACNEVTTGH
jgi:hypothetical protein